MSPKRSFFTILILTGFISALAALPAHADEWSKTYTLTGKPDLRVDTSDANIRVSTWDQNAIEPESTTREVGPGTSYKIGKGVLVEEHQNGNRWNSTCAFRRGTFVFMGYRSVDIDIQMPREGRVTCTPATARSISPTLRAKCQLRSGRWLPGIDNVDGKLRATTGDGHIRANGRFDELELKDRRWPR